MLVAKNRGPFESLRTSSCFTFKTSGQGFPLFLGYPVSASLSAHDPHGAIAQGYVERLSERYRVLVVDYPGEGENAVVAPDEFTADRACQDLLEVADAAGFERFAWWGFSWGAIIGLQLACRTDRLAALICGGWSPLGDLYSDLLPACRAQVGAGSDAERYVTFYESIRDWPEREAVERISCPRMTFAGSHDEPVRAGRPIRIAESLRKHRRQLETWGWEVMEIPDWDHSLWANPATVVPPVRSFLDRVV
jgi:dienelactone hydrolase